jgi:predicted transcriptional regulator of viral defense system
LTDEIPVRIHLAVPRGSRPPAIHEPPTTVHVFEAKTFDVDRRQETTDAGEPFWIYSAERSIVDAMRMSRWVGRDIALGALRRYTSRPRANPARLAELARELGGSAQIQPALEALLS